MRYVTLQRPRQSLVALLTFLTALLAFTGAWAKNEPGKRPSITFVPVLTVSKTSLNPFTAQVGQNSPTQEYNLTMTGFAVGDEVFINTPEGFEINVSFSNTDDGIFAPSSVLVVGNETIARIKVRLRNDKLPGNYGGAINHAVPLNVGIANVTLLVNGTITPLQPSLTSFGALPLQFTLSSTQGETPVSQNVGFNVNDLLRTGSQTFFITVGNNFEISADANGPYSESLLIPFPEGSGVLVNGSGGVFLRLKATVPVGIYNTVVSVFNQQASLEIPVVGARMLASQATAGVSPASLTGFQSSQGNPSVDQNYLLSATKLPSQTVSQFTVVAPNGFEVSAQKAGPYQDNITVGSDADDQDGVNDFANLQKSIFVRLKSGLTPGTFLGDVLNINSLVGTRKVAVSGQSFANVPPVLSSGTTILPALSTNQGVASAEKNYLLVLRNSADFSGTNTSVVAPAGFEVGKTTGGPFSDNLTIAFSDWKLESNGDRTKPIFVRIKASAAQGTLSGSITNEFGQLSNFSVAVSGTVNAGPATSVNPGSLSDFFTIQGTPSAAKSFTLSGTNLPVLNPAIIGVSATAPAGYEVATSASGPFSDQLQTLTGVASNGTGSRELFVRLKGTAAGSVNGTVQAQLGNITSSNLAVSGTVNGVNQPTITLNPTSLSGFSTVQGTPSASQTYLFSFLGSGPYTLTAPDGYELAVEQNTDFTKSDSVGALAGPNDITTSTIFVRLAANAPQGAVNGSIAHSFGTTSLPGLPVSGVVNAPVNPAFSISPTDLSQFVTTQGTPSSTQSIIISGTGLAVTTSPVIEVKITAPTGFEVAESANGPFSDQLNTATGITLNGTASKESFIRLKGTATGSIFGDVVVQLGSIKPQNLTASGLVLSGNPPNITINSTTLSVFTAVQGQPSAVQLYVVTQDGFKPGDQSTLIKAPNAFEIRTRGEQLFSNQLTFEGNTDQVIEIRLKGGLAPGTYNQTVSHENPLATTVTLAVIGTVVSAGQPTVTVNPTSFTDFVTLVNTPSEGKRYVVTTSGFSNDATLTLKAPNGYQIRQFNNLLFEDQIEIGASDGDRDVVVALKANATPGVYQGNVTHESPLIATVNLPVSGTVNAVLGQPTLSVNPTSLNGFINDGSTPSATQQYQLTGANLTGNLNLNAPTGFEIKQDGTAGYSNALSVDGNGTKIIVVRLKTGLAPGNFSGNITHSHPQVTTANVALNGTVTAPPPTGGNFQLIAPLYNCATGAITFQTSGGNGSTIIFSAIGITGPTTNPNQFVDAESRTAADAPPILLRASQNGIEVTFLFDIRATCPVGGNKPPFFNGPLASQTVQQGSNFNFSLPAGTFTDPENQPLTLSATGLPNGLSFNGSTISGTPTQSGNFVVTIKATDPNGLSALGTFTLTVTPTGGPDPNPGGGNLQLVAPLYNCQTGAFTFQTTGGNGSTITFSAIGITGPTTNPNQFVDGGLRQAADAKPITLRASQSGTEVTFVFDIRAICPVGGNPPPAPPTNPGNPPTPPTPPTGGSLQLLTPTYDCQTGAFTFRTTGGNGTAIEFSAVGITGPTTNPNQFVDKDLRTAADAQPITLRAKQSGVEVTFIFDIRATCPIGTGARQPAPAALTPELGSKLTALVYPNPVQDEFTVGIEGAQDQTVRLLLTDLNRHILVDKLIVVTTMKHEERLRLDGQPGGMYVLLVGTARQIVTLKVIKQ